MRSEPIKIAILAMGGEGGGVLADWIVDLGEANGYIAQTTSVPGVAQRTGATIYYVELFPRGVAERDGGRPVLALMPLPGDVDVVLASELMEAGRAVQRGLVTPDRTTLIASTHRVYAISEKTVLGDGRVDSQNLLTHGEAAAKRFVRFDMAQVAEDNGSVISAVLFGALAATGVLPLGRAQFEATIERGGVGVKASLKAFAAGFEHASRPEGDARVAAENKPQPALPTPRDPQVQALVARVRAELPTRVQPFALEGVRRLIDYQDPAYAALYLDRLARVRQFSGTGDHMLLNEAARHLALWMSYEDTIRVADLKTRGSRFDRVRTEVRVQGDQVVAINEFMHPRLQEICETLPAALGRWLANSHTPRRLVERSTRKGRVVNTTSLRGFLLLYLVAGCRRWRRGTLRYALENSRIEQWLQRIEATAKLNPQLATEVVLCQRLVKGYSDTHERGLRNFETLMAAVDQTGAAMAPATLRELREAALADEHGDALRATLARHGISDGSHMSATQDLSKAGSLPFEGNPRGVKEAT
ncbi:MAG TPA: indolepyruvate oxidoreductase subunit beta family protein [Burkholderiaceae bacterium]|nr:indolepyruvate oxidoreductase subunit beta family protein [Burkholderiaceae bacterium]